MTFRLLPAPGCSDLSVDFVKGHASGTGLLGIGGKLLHGTEHAACNRVRVIEHAPVIHEHRTQRSINDLKKFSWSDNKTAGREMLDIARYQVRPIVSLSQDHIIKDNVLWIGEHDSTWRSIDIQAVLQQLGNYSLNGLLLQIEFRTRKNFLVFGKNFIVHKRANATRKNSLNNLQYGRFRRFGNQSGHNDISINDCINHEPPQLSYLPAR